ncbi:MAG: ATP-binding protein, partial [Betaproteobacteria bacterium]
VANDLNKEIYFEVDFPPVTAVPEQLVRICQEVLPQLVRNAIVHGIEHQEERLRSGKQPVGHVLVRFEFEGSSGFRVRVRDDGGGLCLPALRQRAVETGRYSERDIQQMGDHQVVSMLFEPGFTTVEEVHLHAGRGDGLSVVRDALENIGARLRILSTPNAFTEFVIYKGV